MNTCKRTLLSMLFISSTVIPARPLSETTAVVGAGVAGILAGAAAGAGTYIALKDKSDQTVRIGSTGLAAVGASGLTGYCLYQLLHSLTPPGRIAKASILINSAAYDSLVSNEFADKQALFSHATARFGTSWPLVIARERYTTIRQDLEESRDLIDLVYQEVQRDSSYAHLCDQCRNLRQTIGRIENIIEPRITTITKNEKYDLQIKLYEKHMEAERKRAHKEFLKYAKLAHDSIERERDRLHDSKERSKDRGEQPDQKVTLAKTVDQKNIEHALHELKLRKNSNGFGRMWKGIITSYISDIRNTNPSMADGYQEQYDITIAGGRFLEEVGAIEEIVRAKTRHVENALYDLNKIVKQASKETVESWQKHVLDEINLLPNEQDKTYYKNVYDIVMARRNP